MAGLLRIGALALLMSVGPLAAHAQCPYAFKLRGSGIDKLWKQTTNNQWAKMLPAAWQDKGFHFYSRIRERGPAVGINTPSDFESEMLKQVRDEATTNPPTQRRQIVLPMADSKGKHLKVIYDYAGGKRATCQLVTLTF